MMKLNRITLFSLVVFTAFLTPNLLPAQTSPSPAAPATTAPAPAPKKHTFKGKVTAVSAKAQTLTVQAKALLNFTLTPTTKIMKEGKPVTLADVKVGEDVHGGYTTGADGKLTLKKLIIGVKP